jgi:ATP-dependent Lhr-like helicase
MRDESVIRTCSGRSTAWQSTKMTTQLFHSAVSAWFSGRLGQPTECQQRAWPAIRRGGHTLIAAPTGSGKTLAAFLCAIDDLVREGAERGLSDETHVVYVSPLRALSNDIERNLQAPLAGIRDELLMSGVADVDVRVAVRTGDTPAYARALMRKRAPHIVVTTPESLYILVTSASGRRMLRTMRTVIIDEIHALSGSKRGAHLALTLERLSALCEREPARIGLSATQKPIEEVARFLTGTDFDGKPQACEIIDLGHQRDRDLALAMPNSPLEAVMSGEVWGEIYEQLATLASAHRSTLVFVNTRRMAERVAHHLSERLGEKHVAAHHGSLSREHRLDAEQRLKNGALRVMVATASLELGIDIGDIDLVCQIGSPHAINAFLQRAGRAGHAVSALPKARLFPLSRDELIECLALLDSVQRGELDTLEIPPGSLDVMTQHIVAAVSAEEWSEAELHRTLRRAWPYRDLDARTFGTLSRMLSEGYTTRRGRAGAYLHRDVVQGRLRARRGARLTAMTCGGAIPDNADYDVREEPSNTFVGTVNEDFAIESMAGDIFQLGNTSWRILRVESGTVRVEDARGQPPSIPFWLGEAPARSHALSQSVSRLRIEFERELGQAEAADQPARERLVEWLASRSGVPAAAAEQAVDYLTAARRALGVLPTQQTLVAERFFDEAGGMQLILHSPFGGRLNRAWGLALRKCFCRRFNFELQAAATEDAIILSLGETHSFPLEEVFRFLHPNSAREVLVQALLDAPMFNVRWRWNVAVSLAVPRYSGGKKVPPRLQRLRAEDLMAVVFPDGRACFENIENGKREIPDHPLVKQVINDCLHEAMDIEALEELLRAMYAGERRVVARDLTEPSPLAAEILTARPYAFLDDAPLEERRTLAVTQRRWLNPEEASDLGQLDPQAIERVCAEAWPEVSDADELHDALMWLGFLTNAEIDTGATELSNAHATRSWREWLSTLVDQRRATRLELSGGACVWAAVERTPLFERALGVETRAPDIEVPGDIDDCQLSAEAALVEIVRGRLQGLGPVTAEQLSATLNLPPLRMEPALLALESEGFVLRGRFTAGAEVTQWCERRLLARIHQYTLERLRRAIQPVSACTFMRFLFRWQHVLTSERLFGESALLKVIEQLEGFPIAASAWEKELLASRMMNFAPAMLDNLCLSGRVLWMRAGASGTSGRSVRAMPVMILPRRHRDLWSQLRNDRCATEPTLQLPADSERVRAFLAARGPSFSDEICECLVLDDYSLRLALAPLTLRGTVVSDSFEGLRQLMRRAKYSARVGGGSGRWSLTQTDGLNPEVELPAEELEHVARVLLRRYGVLFRRLLDRESSLPPWWRLLRVLRRMEARGEVRGGRFIGGMAGEQFALPEAVSVLRSIPEPAAGDEWVVISAADPLNLTGILLPGPRLPALPSNRLLLHGGQVAARLQAGQIEFGPDLDGVNQIFARSLLLNETPLESIPRQRNSRRRLPSVGG